MTDAALVTVTVLDVRTVQKGQIIILAAVEIELDRVAFALNGLQPADACEFREAPNGDTLSRASG